MEKQNELSSVIASCQRRSTLPKRELQKFDGVDITKYKIFILNFDRNIDYECANDSARYLYLQQYTEGKAKRLVDSCSNYDAATAYHNARRLLDREFGNEFKVSSAYLDRLHSWPSIKADDVTALEDLSIFLVECSNYCESMSIHNHLHSPEEIMRIVRKLPYKLRDKWRTKCHNLHENCLQVQFNHLVNFVSDQTAVLKQPIFGNINDETPKRSSGTSSGNRTRKALATTTMEISSSNSEFCSYCKRENHVINECRTFEKLNPDKKSKFVRDSSLCFGCLKGNHISRNCNRRLKCDICSKMHPTVLHSSSPPAVTSSHQREASSRPSYQREASSHSSSLNEVTEYPQPSTSSGNHSSSSLSTQTTICASKNSITGSAKVIVPHVPVRVSVSNGKEFAVVNCALDACATDCWASERLVKKLNIKTQPGSLAITTMYGPNKSMRIRVLNNLIVSDRNSNKNVCVPVVLTKPPESWPFSPEDVLIEDDIQHLDYLADVPFDFTKTDIDLLIGGNMPSLVMPLETVSGPLDMPYATRHILGWALNGPVNRKTMRSMCNRISISEGLHLDAEIDRLISHEFVDVHPTEKGISSNDAKFLERVNASIKKTEDSHFEIELPVKVDAKFPSNKRQALSFFMNTKKRFQKNESLFKEYNEFMTTMFDRGFAEIIPQTEINDDDVPNWYITHHAVYHKRKNKLRVVFNCSLKCNGVSLNDNLLQGPDLTSNLFGVLLRFRQYPIAVVGDIQKMFYQVRVPRTQANLLKFFWQDSEANVVECRLLVHVFGAVSSPSVAQYALRETVKEINDNEPVKATVLKNFYVDDMLKSFKNVNDATKQVPDVIKVLENGGFNLTQFNSNSPEVLKIVEASHPSPTVELTSTEDATRTLGVTCKIKTDALG